MDQLNPLPFFNNEGLDINNPFIQSLAWRIHLAFLLKKAGPLAEQVDEIAEMQPGQLILLENALFALIEMGEWDLAQEKLDALFDVILDVQAVGRLSGIQKIIWEKLKNFKNKPT